MYTSLFLQKSFGLYVLWHLSLLSAGVMIQVTVTIKAIWFLLIEEPTAMGLVGVSLEVTTRQCHTEFGGEEGGLNFD